VSQNEAILEVLLRGETVTPFSAFALCSSLATHSRIAELRALGYEIDCRMVHRNGKRFGEYKLRNGK
jgi:hypothetical protein